MNLLNCSSIGTHLTYTQKHSEEIEQPQTQSKTIIESQLDMANKGPFHFLHLIQKQLIEEKKLNLFLMIAYTL